MMQHARIKEPTPRIKYIRYKGFNMYNLILNILVPYLLMVNIVLIYNKPCRQKRDRIVGLIVRDVSMRPNTSFNTCKQTVHMTMLVYNYINNRNCEASCNIHCAYT